MEYSVNLVNVDRELADGHYKASVVYTFTISNGLVNTRGNVVPSEGGVEIIEQRGKDPKVVKVSAVVASMGGAVMTQELAQ